MLTCVFISSLHHARKQHSAQPVVSSRLDFMYMCSSQPSCSHYLMRSQCEPSQSWYAAGVQEDLTGIDGKNCPQIINSGHPHVTKKVMHIKITHLFELYISVWAVNRLPLYIWEISKCFNWFSDGLDSSYFLFI